MLIGNRITNYRKQKGISQEELAEKLKVSRQAISRWENDEVVPDGANLIKMSEFFGASIDEILGNNTKTTSEVVHSQPDVFDKGVNFVKRHWAKYGYYLCFGGVANVAVGFIFWGAVSFYVSTSEGMFSNSMASGMEFDNSDPISTFIKFVPSLFIFIGIATTVVGVALIIHDRKIQKRYK